jgi:hypothetical protein
VLPVEEYAYLLGMYLGDGCLYCSSRGTSVLRISLDEAYPGIVASTREAILAVRGGRLPHAAREKTCACIVITSYWRAWPCVLPQHGPGRKHHRHIELADWQRRIVEAAPEAFLRALIHTDGRRGLNRVRVKGRDYAHPRYQFSNRSADIRGLVHGSLRSARRRMAAVGPLPHLCRPGGGGRDAAQVHRSEGVART